MWLALVAAVAVAPWRLSAAEAPGPAKGSEAPLLHVDAFNDKGGEYCVTCKAGKAPAVVAFVTRSDDAARAAIVALDKQYQAAQEAKKVLHAAVVIVSRDKTVTDALVAFAKERKLAVPTGVIAPDHRDLPKWKLSEQGGTLVSLIKGHKIQGNLTDPKADAVAEGVNGLLG
jgi:hypothetical protein